MIQHFELAGQSCNPMTLHLGQSNVTHTSAPLLCRPERLFGPMISILPARAARSHFSSARAMRILRCSDVCLIPFTSLMMGIKPKLLTVWHASSCKASLQTFTIPAVVKGQRCLRLESVPQVWFQDLSCKWYFLCKTFSDYFRLLVMHLGLPNWHYSFTEVSPPSFGETRFCITVDSSKIPTTPLTRFLLMITGWFGPSVEAVVPISLPRTACYRPRSSERGDNS